MRSTTQTITMDRLAAALAEKGVSLKRSDLIEIAARAFGLADGNILSAHMKRGEFDPPLAEDVGSITAAGAELRILRDPRDSALCAIDAARIDSAMRRDRFAVSPYGGMLRLPDVPADTARITATADVKPHERSITRVPPPVEGAADPWAHPRRFVDTEEFDVFAGPVLTLRCAEIVLVDGKPNLCLSQITDYDDHREAAGILCDLEEFRTTRGPRIETVGGTLRWWDSEEGPWIVTEILIPVGSVAEITEQADWIAAVRALLLADLGPAIKATFNPESWIRDNAVPVDCEGDQEFDVTWEILTMGRGAALAMRDNRDESDALREALDAPEWIRDWSGPFRIEIEDGVPALHADIDAEWEAGAGPVH